MNKIYSNQKGFTMVEGLLIMFVVLLVGFIAYFVYSQNNQTNKGSQIITSQETTNSQNSVQGNNESMIFGELYSTKGNGKEIKFYYPDTWKIQQKTANDSYDRILARGGDVLILVSSVEKTPGGESIGGYGCVEGKLVTQLERFQIPKAENYEVLVAQSKSLYAVEVREKSSVSSINVGSDWCTFALDGNLTSGDRGFIKIEIVSNNINNANDAGDPITQDQVSNFLRSTDFKEAIKILQTLEIN